MSQVSAQLPETVVDVRLEAGAKRLQWFEQASQLSKPRRADKTKE